MKKIMTALLAAVTAMMMTIPSFAAEDPAAVLDRVAAKNNALDSMDCDMGIHAIMMMVSPNEYEDVSLNLDMQMKIKMDGVNSNQLRYKAETATEFLGQTAYANMFYKDGYLYMESEGQKIKYPMDLDSMVETAETANMASGLTSSFMKNVSLNEVNGVRVLSYEADKNKMNTYLKEALGELYGGMDLGLNISVQDLKGSFILNADDYYTNMNMDMVLSMTEDDETLVMLIKIEGTVNNPGQPVEMSLPSTDGYQDLEEYYRSLFSDYGYSGSYGSSYGPASDTYY